MKRFLLLPLTLLFISTTLPEATPAEYSITSNSPEEVVSLSKKIMAFDAFVESFYDCLNTNQLKKSLLANGLKGYYALKAENKLGNENFLTLIDYTLPSNKKRFYLIDMINKKIIAHSIIAHGRNSGGLKATKFSNEKESRMTSLGFYTTGAIYNGKYDYSMKIHGLEYSNNKAFERGVVVHSADYATKEFLKKNGNVLGRSFGCPALPHANYKSIVNKIKGGSCLFIYGKDSRYKRKSTYLKTNRFIHSFYSDFQP